MLKEAEEEVGRKVKVCDSNYSYPQWTLIATEVYSLCWYACTDMCHPSTATGY